MMIRNGIDVNVTINRRLNKSFFAFNSLILFHVASEFAISDLDMSLPNETYAIGFAIYTECIPSLEGTRDQLNAFLGCLLFMATPFDLLIVTMQIYKLTGIS